MLRGKWGIKVLIMKVISPNGIPERICSTRSRRLCAASMLVGAGKGFVRAGRPSFKEDVLEQVQRVKQEGTDCMAIQKEKIS